MFVALIAKDKPQSLEVRKTNRDAHVTYLKETDVDQAGPFIDNNGDIYGSLVLSNASSIRDAQTWADNDPYAKAGLFQSVDLQLWNKGLGE